jgi:hypothetical protein
MKDGCVEQGGMFLHEMVRQFLPQWLTFYFS